MTRRLYCNQCKKPKTSCFCKNIIPQHNKTKIIILQHPTETEHYLNTAIMAKLTFNSCDIYNGVDFSEHYKFNESLKNALNPILVYPQNSQSITQVKNNDFIEMADLIIVLDGTWRKVKQIYNCTPILKTLERIELNLNLEKNYKIRKSQNTNQYSTFEAITYTLELIENKSFKSGLTLLTKQVDFHIKLMGEKFKKNYL